MQKLVQRNGIAPWWRVWAKARSAGGGAIRLAYEQRGVGPLLLLVQGLGQPGGMWLALAGGMAKSGYRVLTPDNRGTGDSDKPPPPYRMRDLADDLAAVIDDAGGGPAIVLGISFGGMVVQHLALRRPELVAGLVLAATTCGLPHGTPPRLPFLWQMARLLSGRAGAATELRSMLVHPKTLVRHPDLLEAWDREALRRPTPVAGYVGQLAAAATHSTGFALHAIRCPTEVVTGADDRIMPPHNSEVLARRIPGARLTVIPEAGHAFPLEAPRALPEAIRRVRERIAEPGAARPGATR